MVVPRNQNTPIAQEGSSNTVRNSYIELDRNQTRCEELVGSAREQICPDLSVDSWDYLVKLHVNSLDMQRVLLQEYPPHLLDMRHDMTVRICCEMTTFIEVLEMHLPHLHNVLETLLHKADPKISTIYESLLVIGLETLGNVCLSEEVLFTDAIANAPGEGRLYHHRAQASSSLEQLAMHWMSLSTDRTHNSDGITSFFADALRRCRERTVPTTQRPKLDETGLEYSFAAEKGVMKDKLRTVLRIAATHDHPELCMGAFGVGYGFENPAARVSEMCREILFCEEEFHSWFSAVIFVIQGSEHDGSQGEVCYN